MGNHIDILFGKLITKLFENPVQQQGTKGKGPCPECEFELVLLCLTAIHLLLFSTVAVDAKPPRFMAKFAHKENVVFRDPTAIRREIEQRTNDLAGKGKVHDTNERRDSKYTSIIQLPTVEA